MPTRTWVRITHKSGSIDLEGVRRPKPMAGRLAAIFTDGLPTPLVTSLVSSKTLSKLFEVTMGQDTTFDIDDSFSGRIVLAAAAMDTTLKDFIEARQNILGLAREVKRIGVN
jgi:hypothetical protein